MMKIVRVAAGSDPSEARVTPTYVGVDTRSMRDLTQGGDFLLGQPLTCAPGYDDLVRHIEGEDNGPVQGSPWEALRPTA